MRALYYSPSLNRFTDVEGCVIHDLHEIFEVWKLDAWKKSRANASILEDRHGDQWEVFRLTAHEENDMFKHIDWLQSFGIRMDRTLYTGGVTNGK